MHRLELECDFVVVEAGGNEIHDAIDDGIESLRMELLDRGFSIVRVGHGVRELEASDGA